VIYPCHVYCSPGPYQTATKAPTWGCKTVNDAAEHHAALCDGWHDTMQSAIESAGNAKPSRRANVSSPMPSVNVEQDNSAPTRAEMETKAAELGIKFDGRTGDKRLLERINEALKG
jgi:hypothetical protein